MNRLKGRMLAGVLAAVTLFSSVTPGTVRAAEPSEADTSVEAFSVAEESEPESTEGLEESDTTSDESSGEAAAETTAAEEDEEEDAAGKALEEGQEGGQTDENAEEADDSEPGSGEGTTQTVLSELKMDRKTGARRLHRRQKKKKTLKWEKRRLRQAELRFALILRAVS